MSVKTFMINELEKIKKNIINELPISFDSHQFIRLFAREFETDYVKFLVEYDDKPFSKVHAQIGSFLAENQSSLGIIDTKEKTSSPNIFGDSTTNELWKRES